MPPLFPTLGMAKPALGRGLGALLGGSPIAKPPSPARLRHTAATPAPQVTCAGIGAACTAVPRPALPFPAAQEFARGSPPGTGRFHPGTGHRSAADRARNGKHLELIAGERRWRAAQLLGLAEVPVIVREADDRAVLELALIENLQRENLNPIEEAQATPSWSPVSAHPGGSRHQSRQEPRGGGQRPAPAEAPGERSRTRLREGRLSVGHAKVILGLGSRKAAEARRPSGSSRTA